MKNQNTFKKRYTIKNALISNTPDDYYFHWHHKLFERFQEEQKTNRKVT